MVGLVEGKLTLHGVVSPQTCSTQTTRAELLSSAEEAGSLIAFASDWLELDSPVEGIRFDSELVRRLPTSIPIE